MTSYWYKLWDSNTRINYRLDGVEPEPIKLYPETQEILDSFHEPTNPEGWNRLTLDEQFGTLEDAEEFFYKNEDAFVKRILELRREQ